MNKLEAEAVVASVEVADSLTHKLGIETVLEIQAESDVVRVSDWEQLRHQADVILRVIQPV
jgi:hypothetical protein